MKNSIKLAVEHLYQVFKIYNIEDLTKVSCFDYGPTAEELAGITKDLRNIPTEVIDAMEFYGAEWGTDNEVKYFLPRILECISEDISRLEDPGYFSLFKYKLRNCFSTINNDGSKEGVVIGIPLYSNEERDSLSNYFDALLTFHFSNSLELGYLIECVLILDISHDKILAQWKSDKKLHKQQVINLFNHFNCPDYGKTCSPRGVYLDDSGKIKKFLDLVYLNLTPEELAEISFV